MENLLTIKSDNGKLVLLPEPGAAIEVVWSDGQVQVATGQPPAGTPPNTPGTTQVLTVNADPVLPDNPSVNPSGQQVIASPSGIFNIDPAYSVVSTAPNIIIPDVGYDPAYVGAINDDKDIIEAIQKAQSGPLPNTTNRLVFSGINKFKDGNNLSGCIRDMMRLPVFCVRKLGFLPTEIRWFFDEDARKQQLLEAWAWAAVAQGTGGVGHSGHGAQNENYIPGEPPSVVRVICMQDFDWTVETAISNLEVKATLGSMKGGFVWFDTCFSGNMLRAMKHNGHPPMRAKTMEAPADIQLRINAIHAAGGVHFLMKDALPGITMFEACGPNQTSADSQDESGNPVGAGSFYALRRLELEYKTPSSQWVKHVDADLARDQYDQISQVEGATIDSPLPKAMR